MSASATLELPDLAFDEDSAAPPASVRPQLHDALALLLQAHEYAEELGQDVWDLAVELDELRRAHVTNSDLRWLVAKGYAEHGIEITSPEDRVRRFLRPALIDLRQATTLVLSPLGLSVARDLGVRDLLHSARRIAAPSAAVSAPEDPLPRWDRQRRQLRVGAQVVKEFKLPSPNQETVLMAFEEEGWPPRIDDPLPGQPQLDPRRRLHDTIKALNRKQKRQLIRFMGDGGGEGIRWEFVGAPAHR